MAAIIAGPSRPISILSAAICRNLREQLIAGQVAIGSVLAERTKLKVGDGITLESQDGPKKFPIAAIINDYQNGGLTIHMERKIAHEQLGLEGVNAYIITADHNRTTTSPERAEKNHSRERLAAVIFRRYSANDRRHDVRRGGGLWSMVVLLLVVSAVGVTNTLTINVLEQTREIGLLRIVAMTATRCGKPFSHKR